MTRGIDRRLTALEGAAGGDVAVVWRNCGEPAGDVITRTFPGGVPAGQNLCIVSWMPEDQDGPTASPAAPSE